MDQQTIELKFSVAGKPSTHPLTNAPPPEGLTDAERVVWLVSRFVGVVTRVEVTGVGNGDVFVLEDEESIGQIARCVDHMGNVAPSIRKLEAERAKPAEIAPAE